jgi:23S rRNA (cytidine1920-2'-O)/16S rRNA (cytidine1409-2'-O)-methyltransferase
VASPLPGPSGNVEYFLRLRLESGSTSELEIKSLIEEAIEKGPQ